MLAFTMLEEYSSLFFSKSRELVSFVCFVVEIIGKNLLENEIKIITEILLQKWPVVVDQQRIF